MDLKTLCDFFMWCTVINGALLLFSTVTCTLGRGLVYRIQHVFFPVSRETYTGFLFGFIAAYKLLWIVFNVVPWIALLIIRSVS